MGYVREAFGALNVESQCSWAVVRTPEARGDSTGAVLGQCLYCLCAILAENIETSWVTSLWLLALSVLRVNVRGLSCRTPYARGDSTGAVLGQVSIGSCAILGENIETSWVTFVWRLAL